MMKTKVAIATVALLSLGGCAIQQTVKPIDRFESKVVCIVENPDVRPGFLETYKRTLSNKGYVVKQLAPNSSLIECPITSTYIARWRWDLAMYMSYADITVYNNAKPSGKATYDATRGGGNMNKFIEADKKITELVNQLFPAGALP
jgi:uncharacterized secreted protein with C-terminal beta-propeller domain